MPEIEDILIDRVIPTLRFQCDVKRCKGACCTLPGGKGAPLLDEEIEHMHRAFPIVKRYLSEKHLEVIRDRGMFEGQSGDFVTTCVDNKACVFVTYEDGIARCSFEKAFLNGETNWRKPLSCHLFPIRIDRGIDGERIRYEHLEDCHPALERGSKEDTPLPEFTRDALIRAYGDDWYRQFLDYCQSARRNQRSSGT